VQEICEKRELILHKQIKNANKTFEKQKPLAVVYKGITLDYGWDLN